MTFLRLMLVVFAVAMSAGAGVAPPNPDAPANVENEQIRTDTDASSGGATHALAGGGTSSDSGLLRVVLALAVVVLIIWTLRAIARKMQLVLGGGKSNRAVRVLSRTTISPRQQVILLQVGKRLIVVGDSGGRLSPLSDITDPDEVAALVGQTQAETTPKLEPAVFEQAFDRATQPFEQIREETAVEPEHEEMVGLLDKVRAMRQQFTQA